MRISTFLPSHPLCHYCEILKGCCPIFLSFVAVSISLCRSKFLTLIVFYLLEELPLTFHQSRPAGIKFPVFVYLWVYFSFTFKDYFHWVNNSGLTDFFFFYLFNVSCLLSCMISVEKSMVIFIFVSLTWCDSLSSVSRFFLWTWFSAFWIGYAKMSLSFGVFVLSGDFWASWICDLLSVTNFGK